MMEAAVTSEMLVNFYQKTRRYYPENSHLHFCFVGHNVFSVTNMSLSCLFIADNATMLHINMIKMNKLQSICEVISRTF
jgi:hypothetical protein